MSHPSTHPPQNPCMHAPYHPPSHPATHPSAAIIPPSILDYDLTVRQIVRSLCVGECHPPSNHQASQLIRSQPTNYAPTHPAFQPTNQLLQLPVSWYRRFTCFRILLAVNLSLTCLKLARQNCTSSMAVGLMKAGLNRGSGE